MPLMPTQPHSPPALVYMRHHVNAPLHEVPDAPDGLPRTPPPRASRPPTPGPLAQVSPSLPPPRRHHRSYQQMHRPPSPPTSWMPSRHVDRMQSPHESLQHVVDAAPMQLPDMQTRPMFRTQDGRFTYSYFGNVDAEACVVLTCRVADLRAALAEAPASVLDAILRAGDYLVPMTPDGTPLAQADGPPSPSPQPRQPPQ